MRWHSYQSLVARARPKRVGSAGKMPVPRQSFDYDDDYEHEQEQEQEQELRTFMAENG